MASHAAACWLVVRRTAACSLPALRPAAAAASAPHQWTCLAYPPLLQPQSVACQPCPPGKFAYSWGSSYCKNCIVGTYAPKGEGAQSGRAGQLPCVVHRPPGAAHPLASPACPTQPPPCPCSPVRVPSPAARSSLCLACPNGTSTIDDGSSSCAPSLPVNYSAPRQGSPALWAFAGCHRRLMRSIRSAPTHVPACPPNSAPGTPDAAPHTCMPRPSSPAQRCRCSLPLDPLQVCRGGELLCEPQRAGA